MNRRPLTIAVTGLNATDNPAPGVGVLRSLRLDGNSQDRLIGLAYDALDSGIYTSELVSDVFMLPYPSSTTDSYLARITAVHEAVGLDVIIPTLDAELPAFMAMEARLQAMGIGVLLPTRDQFDIRSKAKLWALGVKAGINVPATATVNSAEELMRIHERIPYPFFVKGVFYGAVKANNVDEALGGFHKMAAQWGLPIIVQSQVHGEELNVVALGDGQGGLIGAVPMKKLLLTDKGKGWAGITIRDPGLLDLTERFMKATRWRGPCEVEVIRDDKGDYHLLEINPRFPAWVHLSAAAGSNLPRAAAELAAGMTPRPVGEYRVGTMFVRLAYDQIVSLSDFEQVVTSGHLSRNTRLNNETFTRQEPPSAVQWS